MACPDWTADEDRHMAEHRGETIYDPKPDEEREADACASCGSHPGTLPRFNRLVCAGCAHMIDAHAARLYDAHAPDPCREARPPTGQDAPYTLADYLAVTPSTPTGRGAELVQEFASALADVVCACGHPWTLHRHTANGAEACRSFGCGCRDVLSPRQPGAMR